VVELERTRRGIEMRHTSIWGEGGNFSSSKLLQNSIPLELRRKMGRNALWLALSYATGPVQQNGLNVET
jgi:hypothetical protein